MKISAETVAVVTGGASGIGRALVDELLAREAQVVVIDSDPDGIHTVDSLAGVSAHRGDVSDPKAVAEVADVVQRDFGRVDVLIANAGISVAGRLEETRVEDLERVLAVNFWGVVHSCRAFLPLLRVGADQGGATICNILSDFAMIAVPGKTGYAASKYAARALTETLGAELQGSGISVLAAYPGATATKLIERGRAVDRSKQATEAKYLNRGMRPRYVARRIVRGIERGRTRVLIGYDARLIDLATRLAPNATRWAIRRLWRRIPFL